MSLYKTTTTLAAAVSVLALAACNEALVPDYNTPTGYPHSIAALPSEFTGAITRVRNDMQFFVLSGDGFARNAAYYTPSEERFVTQLTGQSLLDDDNFGAGLWSLEYEAVKDADSLQAVLPKLTNSGAALPATNTSALVGVVQTIKALDYMYVALSHDTNGVAMNSPGAPFTGTLAPILCSRDSWKEIVAILDSAKTNLDAGGYGNPLGYPGTVFASLPLPPGMALLGAHGADTAGLHGQRGGFEALTLALRARAHLEYAYAIARGPGGSAPDSASAGSPDQNQLDSAMADIKATILYSPTISSGAAIAANDIGVFHTFSSSAGDFSNPLFGNSASIFVLEGAARQMDTANDQRLLAKFAVAPAGPTSVGASSASSMAWLNNVGLAAPIPIERNIHLQVLLARAYLGTGQLLKAAQTMDAIRTQVGGLPTALAGPYKLIHVDSADSKGNVTKTDTTTYNVDVTNYASVRDFLVREMIPTLIVDGEGEQIASIRDYGVVMQDLTTWEVLPPHKDFHTTMENIPSVERQQRNNNYAPVCP